MTLWNDQLCASIGQSSAAWQASHVAIDTRTMKPQSLFVALRGNHVDGHDLLARAHDGSAAAAMVERNPSHHPHDLPLLRVDDCRESLIAMAQLARARSSARIVAITGSVGKTTCKAMLARLLKDLGMTAFSSESHNNHLGVSLSLANLSPQDAFAVFELGMNKAGEIATLARWVQPHIAIITAIAPAHREFFSSLQAIAHAKGELVDALTKDTIAILPRDSEFYDLLAAKATNVGARVLSFGCHDDSDMRLTDDHHLCFAGQRVSLNLQWRGRHHELNAAAVMLAAHWCGMSLDAAARILNKEQPLQGRGREHTITIDGKVIHLLDESYNANPASMMVSLSSLASHPCTNARRIALLGDMLELGTQAQLYHDQLLPHLTSIDVVHAIGDHMTKLHHQLPPHQQGIAAHSIARAQSDIIASLQHGDVLMVKGSAGVRLASFVQKLHEQNGETHAV